MRDLSGKETKLDKKAVMIIAPIDFRDEELFDTKAVLEEAGVTIDVASNTKKKCFGMLGASVIPDMQVIDINVGSYDAFIFVGGSGASCYWDDAIAHKIASEAMLYNKVVAAICIAPVILANAGILAKRRATVWKSEESKLLVRGALCTGARVTYDGNIITANGPESAHQFGQSIVKALVTV